MDDMQEQDEVQPARYGYGKFYRAVRNSPVFQNFELLQLYTVICCDASIVPRNVSVNTGRGKGNASLRPGEFLSRRESTAAMLGWAESTYEKRLKKLVDYGVITVVRKDYRGTVVTLVDFDGTAKNDQKGTAKKGIKTSLFIDESDFESEETNSLNAEKGTPKEHPSNTQGTAIEKSKKGIKKKEKSIGAVRPTLAEAVAFSEEQDFRCDPNAFFDHFQANGWVQKGGSKIKDWKAAFRNWERNHLKWNKESKPATAIASDEAAQTTQWLIDKQTVRMAEPMKRKQKQTE